MNSTVKIDGFIPIEIKHQALDWINIFLNNIPFLVTICVVLGSAIVTYRINKKSIDNQNEQSSKARTADHENKISEFRHNWLQEVRNTASELIKSIHCCQNHLMLTNLSRDYRDSAKQRGDEEGVKIFQKDVSDNYNKQNEHVANFHMHSAKIKLLFKNGDEQTENLFQLIDDAREKMSNTETRSLDNQKIDNVISELQIILKNEWEVTKTRTWRNAT